MCELTHSADRELQALPLLFKAEVKQSVSEAGKKQSLHVYIYAVINKINIPMVVSLWRRHILFFEGFI